MKIYIKSTISTEYEYCGSIKDMFGNILIRDACIRTRAESIDKARSNILYQAKKRLGLKPAAKLILCNPNSVEELIETDINQETIPNRPRCPECHSELTDGGYCPKCYAEGKEYEM